ncbi:MAG: glycosyltransferase [Thermoanaerobaculia bacterium]
MSRILLYGLCPLPFENAPRTFGPGIRSWQFARGLAAAGHRVRLVACEIPGAYDGKRLVRGESRDGVEIERVDEVMFLDRRALERHLAEHRPDGLVGATVHGAYALARLDPSLPLFADQFGHFMAEAQARAAREGENWPLAHFWSKQREVLRRADKFSVVSARQRYAAIGELGAVGRLTAETCGYEFACVIPCAFVPGPPPEAAGAVRGRLTPGDAFVVLWSGGYNVWSDVETLAAGLEGAMRENPRVHFVSTGGEIAGQDEKTYRELLARIAASPFSERCHLEGWLPAGRVPAYVAEADLGVLTEKPIYEGLLGDKSRVVQWMGHGLAVACNRVGDLGDRLAGGNLGLTFAPGDAPALARHILWAADNPEPLRQMAQRARRHALEELSFEATTRPLQEWAKRPTFSPDAASRSRIASPLDHASLRQRLSAFARRFEWLARSRVLRATWRGLFAVVGKAWEAIRRPTAPTRGTRP